MCCVLPKQKAKKTNEKDIKKFEKNLKKGHYLHKKFEIFYKAEDIRIIIKNIL